MLSPGMLLRAGLRERLSWNNARIPGQDVAASVRSLKGEDGNDLVVIGSAELVRNLLEDNLVIVNIPRRHS
jgi:hypothetical protein